MLWIKRLWCGEVKLWKVWVYGAVIGTVIVLVWGALYWVIDPGRAAIKPGTINVALGWEALISAGFTALSEIFILCWCLAIWRCSKNTGTAFYTYLSRIEASGGVLFVVFALLYLPSVTPWTVTGLDMVQHPNEYYSCGEKILKSKKASPGIFPLNAYAEIHGCIQKMISK